jgi:hypothetical protein
MMNNYYGQGMNMGMGGMGDASPMSNMAQLAPTGAMSPATMNTLLGNPMQNQGANVAPYLSMQGALAPQPKQQGQTQASYRHGGVVQFDEGGQVSPLAQMAEMPPEQLGAESEEAPLAPFAEALEMDDEVQLTFINEEELQALFEMGGEPPMLAEEVAPDPEALQQLMQGAEGEDTILVYLTQEQFQFLTENFGEPTLNQASGLPQFGLKKFVKKVLSNPIVQAVAPIALNAFAPGIGTAIGGALGLGSMGTSALMGGGLGLLGGGGLKGALKGAALGAVGQGVGDYLSTGNNPLSSIFGGSTPNSGIGGISPSAGGVGINPSAGGVGINSATPGADSILKSAPKASGLASLLPSSTAGKVALGLVGANLLGGGMKKPEAQDAGAPPPLPETFSQRLPQLKLNRTQLGANYNPFAAQSVADRTYFNDEYMPLEQQVPVAARRGGLMSYADGGMVDDMEGMVPVPSNGLMQRQGGMMPQQQMMPQMPQQGMNNMMPPQGMMPQMPQQGMPMYADGGAVIPPSAMDFNNVPPLQSYVNSYSQQQQEPQMGMGAMAGMAGLESAMGSMSEKDRKRLQRLLQERAMLEGGGLASLKESKGMAGGGLTSRVDAMSSPRVQGLAPRGMNIKARYKPRMAEGAFIEGAGDGTSDDVEATIEGQQPALLSDGEFVVPSRAVSELGNGSSKAGAKKLQAMVDRIMSKRRQTRDVAHQMDAEQMMPA